ncbi:MAG: hypothetical protein ACP5Q1_02490 [Anaerolineae bacterium]
MRKCAVMLNVSLAADGTMEAKDTSTIKERYIVDESGARIGVLLDIEDYHRLLRELEELESICAYDAAKASGDEAMPFEQAVAEIEKH